LVTIVCNSTSTIPNDALDLSTEYPLFARDDPDAAFLLSGTPLHELLPTSGQYF